MDTKLHEFVRYRDLNGVLAALKMGMDVNSVGILQWTPVQEAACSGDRDVLYHLLSHGGKCIFVSIYSALSMYYVYMFMTKVRLWHAVNRGHRLLTSLFLHC